MEYVANVWSIRGTSGHLALGKGVVIKFQNAKERALMSVRLAGHDRTASLSVVDGNGNLLLESLLDVLASRIVPGSTRIPEKLERESFSTLLWESEEKQHSKT